MIRVNPNVSVKVIHSMRPFDLSRQLLALFAKTRLYVPDVDFSIVGLPLLDKLNSLDRLRVFADEFLSWTIDKDEITLVLQATSWKSISNFFEGAKVETPYRMIVFDIPMDLSVVGYLAQITRILAEAKIGIFAISTFEKDAILVKSEHLQRAVDSLETFIAECRSIRSQQYSPLKKGKSVGLSFSHRRSPNI